MASPVFPDFLTPFSPCHHFTVYFFTPLILSKERATLYFENKICLVLIAYFEGPYFDTIKKVLYTAKTDYFSKIKACKNPIFNWRWKFDSFPELLYKFLDFFCLFVSRVGRRIHICRVPKKLVSSLHTAGMYEKPGPFLDFIQCLTHPNLIYGRPPINRDPSILHKLSEAMPHGYGQITAL